jgi:hypothetical protein
VISHMNRGRYANDLSWRSCAGRVHHALHETFRDARRPAGGERLWFAGLVSIRGRRQLCKLNPEKCA